MIAKIVRYIANGLGAVAATCVAGLMLTVIADTTGRYLLSTPIPGAYDYIRYWWMIIIVFGALGVAESRNEHIEALVLETQMPPRLRVVCRYIRAAVITITLLMFLAAALPAAIRLHLQGQYAAGSEITIWPTRYILLVGVAVFLVTAILKVVEDRRAILKGTLDDEVPAP